LAQDVATDRAQLESAQAQYANALNNFNGTIIKAPFDGQVAAVAVGVGDQATVSSQVSASTAVLTLITPQKIAKITLNEVDVAKVKVGQKTNLTFDAVADLTITGTVVQVDTIGTVSQGVVSYGVNIVFDVQDDRIKPGMSVNANIILDSKTDVLMVPNSVVKNQNEQAYVQELVNGAPQNKNVEVGDSNDTMTEITSGLTEGETVISQTISTNNTGTQTTGSANAKGNGGGIRIPGL